MPQKRSVSIRMNGEIFGTTVKDLASGEVLKVRSLSVRHQVGCIPAVELEVLYPVLEVDGEAVIICARCARKLESPPLHSREDLLWLSVHLLREQRWQQGAMEYRKSLDAPFNGDALAEAIPELVDFLNYADELLRTETDARRRGGVQEAQDSVIYALDLIREIYRG